METKFVAPKSFKNLIFNVIGIAFLAGQCASANTAIVPVPKAPAFHERFVAEAKKGGIDVLFLGDSITQYWKDPERGLPVWEREFSAMRAANFGINGDRIQNVLWRLQNGEGQGFSPKLVVLLLGTNNTAPRNTAAEVVEGLAAVVAELEKDFPDAKILLLGILPRGPKDDPKRIQIAEINRALAQWEKPGRLHFLDIGGSFLDASGGIPADIMPDGLHPSLKGYEIFAEAIREPVRQMLAN